jgi:hypothetical protein
MKIQRANSDKNSLEDVEEECDDGLLFESGFSYKEESKLTERKSSSEERSKDQYSPF